MQKSLINYALIIFLAFETVTTCT